MRLITRALLGAAAIACIVPSAANAVVINLIDVNNRVKGTAAEKGFAEAAKFWEYMLTDNVTVNLEVDFAPLNPGVIGSTGSTRFGVSTASAYAQLAATGQTNLDTIAVANLSQLTALGGLQMITSGYDNDALKTGIDVTKRVFDNDNTANNTTLGVNSATLKALGYNVPMSTVDGRVTFSSNFGFDFNANDGIASNQFDFVGVAIHEIGHALGFTSGVDIYDNPNNVNNPNANANAASFLFTTLDLFRYTNDPTGVAPGSGPVLDFAVGSPGFFSIDGGMSQFGGRSLMSTGRNFGDGQQASHFKDTAGCGTDPIGIMDPTFCFGQLGEVTGTDLAAFDAMGWNLRFDVLRNSNFSVTSGTIQNLAAVPEPTTWAMLIAGFGMVGFTMRRAQRRAAKGAVAIA